jgi:predicted CoA-substrate-specific enzyme activase
MLKVGIDVGSTSTKAIVVDASGKIAFEKPYKRHSGKTLDSVADSLSQIYLKYPEREISSVSFTGQNAEEIAKHLNAPYYMDATAQFEGVLGKYPNAGAIVSIGGQDCTVILADHGHEMGTFMTKNCAAGTGSFLEVQAYRLFESQIKAAGITELDDMLDTAMKLMIEEGKLSTTAAHIAAKCAVFAKTDMTHWQNEGRPIKDTIRGLHKGIAATIRSDVLPFGLKIPEGDQLFIGGGSKNELLLIALQEHFPKLFVPEYAVSMQAYGAAKLSLKYKDSNNVSVQDLSKIVLDSSIRTMDPLAIKRSIIHHGTKLEELANGEIYLGIDVGSTTTKCGLVQISQDNVPRLIHKQYIKTEGEPIKAVKKLLAGIREKYGDIRINGVGTTGSGRKVAGQLVGADLILNEVTAHAIAAINYDPNVETIFEIGGQDSKFTALREGKVWDFDMNKICAAGTGSFLEEVAEKFGINIDGEFERLALLSGQPVDLGERCTVFIESDIMSAMQKGAATKDICAGLASSVAKNYLNKVVGRKEIGERIMFLGGPSKNKAVVAALEATTGKTIVVPPNSEVFGAIGVALQTRDEMKKSGKDRSAFLGYGIIDGEVTRKDAVCNICDNSCTISSYKIQLPDGQTSTAQFGGICGRYEKGQDAQKPAKNYFIDRKEKFEAAIQGHVASDKQVRLLRQLYMHQSGVLWARFFDELGVQANWGGETTPAIVDSGKSNTGYQLCFSSRVSTGHIEKALSTLKPEEMLFLPTMITMLSPTDEESSQFCPWVSAKMYTAKAELNFDSRNILSPTVDLARISKYGKLGMKEVAQAIHENIGRQLDVNARQVYSALNSGLEAQAAFDNSIVELGEKALAEIGNDIAVAVVGRPYLLNDSKLNLDIGSMLARIGLPALQMDMLPFAKEDIHEYKNMYWGQGSRIIRAAKLIKDIPNIYAVCLSNFGCGPDSFISKYVEAEMSKGERKPYLWLEVDEHSNPAGISTRLEAFKHVITVGK